MSIRALRRRMPYEVWYYLHLTSYLVLLLGYGHQFADGQELTKGGFGHWYWVALYVFVVACLIWGRHHRADHAERAPPPAGGRGRRRGRRHGVDLHHRPAPGRPGRAGRAVLPVAVPGPRLLVAGASVLAVGGTERPLAAPDHQGRRRPHVGPAEPAARGADLRGRAVGHLHRRAAPAPGRAADRRRQRHRADPGAAGGAAHRHDRPLPGAQHRRDRLPGRTRVAGRRARGHDSGTCSARATTPDPSGRSPRQACARSCRTVATATSTCAGRPGLVDASMEALQARCACRARQIHMDPFEF